MPLGFSIFWLTCAALTGYIAHLKGRNVPVWLLIGSFFGIFALLFLLFLPRIATEATEAKGFELEVTVKEGAKVKSSQKFEGVIREIK